MPSPKKLRCMYTEGGRRCRRRGSSGGLCEAHRIVLEAEAKRPGSAIVGLIGRILRGQELTDDAVHAGVKDFVSMLSRDPRIPPRSPMDEARARAQDFLRRSRAQAQRKPPPTARKPDTSNHRAVLGFSETQKVTAEEIKRRHRELARKHHPDRGGSLAKMQEINAAVDQLLATL